MTDLNLEPRELAEDLQELEERLKFQTSKAERALNFYAWGQTPQNFNRIAIKEEEISDLLEESYELYESSMMALAYVNMFKSSSQKELLAEKYNQETNIEEWAKLFDTCYEGFSGGLPSGPLIDATAYFEKVDTIASKHDIERSYNLEPIYSSIIEIENGDQRFFETP